MNVWEKLVEISNKYPNHISLKDYKGNFKTYKELIEDTLCYARYIQKLKHQRIGVAFTRSIEYIITILSIWRAGKSFIPFDSRIPIKRIEKIMQESGIDFFITNQSKFKNFIKFEILDRTEIDTSYLFDKNSLAYIIYTSGSSGKPKGICITHRGILNFIEEQIPFFKLNSNSIVFQNLSISFDASLSEIFTTLLSGACLYIPNENSFSIEEMFKSKSTHLFISPSSLELYKADSFPKSLQTIIIGGEAGSKNLIKEFASRFHLVNVYGPTEATVCTSLKKFTSRSNPKNIGKPIKNIEYFLYKKNSSRKGELWITGDSLFEGYIQNSILIKDKLVNINEKTYYKTSDILSKAKNGDYIFHGRIDRQFKIHGQLIEPFEIENEIQKILKTSKIIIRKEFFKKKERLVCDLYAPILFSRTELIKKLREKFPEWMIPKKFQIQYKTSKTISDKLILKSESNHLNKLDSIWKKFTSENISPEENFYDYSDSFDLIQLFSTLAKEKINFNQEYFLSKPTFNRLYESLQKKENTESTKFLLSQLKYYPLLNIDSKNPKAIETILIIGASSFLAQDFIKQMISIDKKLILTYKDNLSNIEDLNVPKIRIDISKKFLGLSYKSYMELSKKIDSIYLFSSIVNFSYSFNDLINVNIEGVYNVLKFSLVNKTKILHYISTLSVFTNSNYKNKIIKEEKTKYQTKIYGGYAQTKWLSEKIIESYSNVKIYRPSLCFFDLNQKKLSKKNLFIQFIKLILKHKKAPLLKQNTSFNFITTNEFAMKLIFANKNLKDQKYFHICSDHNFKYTDLIRILQEFEKGIIYTDSNAKVFEEYYLLFQNNLVSNRKNFSETDLFLSSKFTFDSSLTADFIGKSYENSDILRECIRILLNKKI
jgi:amino acid adenylation domain-containing protein